MKTLPDLSQDIFKILFTLTIALSFIAPASRIEAAIKLGTGNASLLGEDLTDPEDDIKDRPGVDYGQGHPEETMKPEDGAFLHMTMGPAYVPGTPPHQMHPYQSWQGSPACMIFMNKPESRKWYIGFKDGGKGGPTIQEPYYCAVQLKEPTILTHFTITSSMDSPGRDPLSWAIQGSNSGKDGEWVDIFKFEGTDRNTCVFPEAPRSETTLFTSFTTATMSKSVNPANLPGLQSKLAGKTIDKADFPTPTKPYTWFRIVIYSCINPNSTQVADFNNPPGFALGQVELFGFNVNTRPGTKVPPKAAQPIVPIKLSPLKPPVSDLPFLISYWCGPPKDQTTVERYREIAEAGFNVAFPAIDALWSPFDEAAEEHNRKYLDVCKETGLKALVWDGSIPKGENWAAPKAEEIPVIHKAVDGIIARYSKHPALLGYIVCDEPSTELFPRLGIVNQYLRAKDPKHFPYINLLPAYAFNPRPTYEEHISRFLDTVKPAFVSWDHYRQMFEGGDESTYWYNLELMRNRCTEAGLPYNQIIVSMKHMGYRECSEADLRWQVYTSLAFGSRGIQYFTYWFVKELAWADAPALITKEGGRDAKYEYVKKINNRIKNLGPVLVRLVCTGAYCNDPLPPGGVALIDGAPVTKMEGGPGVVGCFQDAAGRRFILPVNRSLRDTVTLSIGVQNNVASVAEISQDNGKTLPAVTLEKSAFQVKLEPGEGRLFHLVPRATKN